MVQGDWVTEQRMIRSETIKQLQKEKFDRSNTYADEELAGDKEDGAPPLKIKKTSLSGKSTPVKVTVLPKSVVGLQVTRPVVSSLVDMEQEKGKSAAEEAQVVVKSLDVTSASCSDAVVVMNMSEQN